MKYLMVVILLSNFSCSTEVPFFKNEEKSSFESDPEIEGQQDQTESVDETATDTDEASESIDRVDVEVQGEDDILDDDIDYSEPASEGELGDQNDNEDSLEQNSQSSNDLDSDDSGLNDSDGQIGTIHDLISGVYTSSVFGGRLFLEVDQYGDASCSYEYDDIEGECSGIFNPKSMIISGRYEEGKCFLFFCRQEKGDFQIEYHIRVDGEIKVLDSEYQENGRGEWVTWGLELL